MLSGDILKTGTTENSFTVNISRASTNYAKNSDKDNLDVDFTSHEAEKARQLVHDLLHNYRKEFVIKKDRT